LILFEAYFSTHFIIKKSLEKIKHRKTRRRWEVNIKMGLQEIGSRRRVDSSGSRQGQVAGSYKHGNGHVLPIKCG